MRCSEWWHIPSAEDWTLWEEEILTVERDSEWGNPTTEGFDSRRTIEKGS